MLTPSGLWAWTRLTLALYGELEARVEQRLGELARQGEQVRVLDNFSTGKRSNPTPFAGRIEVFKGDLRSYPCKTFTP